MAAATELLPLRTAVGLSLPPYVIHEQNRGLELDIAGQALRGCGYRIVPSYIAYGQVAQRFVSGQMDAALTMREQSGVKAYYSASYIRYQDMAISLRSRQLPIKSVQDLRHYRVLAFQNASQELGAEFAALAQGSPHYGETGQQIVQNRMLYSESVDVIVADRWIFQYYARQLQAAGEPTAAVAWHDVLPALSYQVAFRSAGLRDCFNRQLAALRDSGAYQRILNQYLR